MELIVISAIFRTFFGALFGVFCVAVLFPALAAFDAEGGLLAISSLIIILGLAALGFFAPTIRRALGRGFLLLGVSFFALPVSALLFSGRVASEALDRATPADQAGTAIGGGIAMALLTGAGTFIGVTFGVIFTVLGLVLALGGRREVVVVKR
jgi:hypothetical protein